MSRLFVAIELPPRVKQALALLRSPLPGAKWVPMDQLHLTLAFLGEVDDAAIPELCALFSRIRIPEIELHFTTTGCFPGRRNPRVVWVGIQPNPHVLILAAKIRDSSRACGIHLEERPLSAHITLARFKQPVVSETGHFLDLHSSVQISEFRVHEFILYRSKLSSAGAVHTPLERFIFSK